MDEYVKNVKDFATTLAGIVASVVSAAKVLGYEIDPTVIAKIPLDGIAFAVIGFVLIFKVGKK